MQYTEEDLEVLDIDWFAIDSSGSIAHFITTGKGFIPDSVLSSRTEGNFGGIYFKSKTCNWCESFRSTLA